MLPAYVDSLPIWSLMYWVTCWTLSPCWIIAFAVFWMSGISEKKDCCRVTDAWFVPVMDAPACLAFDAMVRKSDSTWSWAC